MENKKSCTPRTSKYSSTRKGKFYEKPAVKSCGSLNLLIRGGSGSDIDGIGALFTDDE